jgi:lysophospholipase L1-like esterase
MVSNISHPAPYNNLGIPGALAAEIPTATSSAVSLSGSDFFDLVLRNPNLGNTNTTVIQQALLLNPTFATVWLGNNDVLGYAAAGGVAPGLPIPVANVQAAIGAVLQSLTAGGADVAIANIPSILSAPYFTTIKPFLTFPGTSIPLLDGNNAKQYFIGPTGAKLTDDDLITLAAQDTLGKGAGTYFPLPDKYVLSATEQWLVDKSIGDYNTAISSLATQYGAVLVDVNALFLDIDAHGIEYGGVTFTSQLVLGGIFSLDGIHPSDFGQSIVANHFIKAINAKYEADIPLVDVGTSIVR